MITHIISDSTVHLKQFCFCFNLNKLFVNCNFELSFCYYSFGRSKLKSPIGIIPCEFKGGQWTIKLNLRSSLPAVYHDGWIYETSAVHKHILTSAHFCIQGIYLPTGGWKIMETASDILKSRRRTTLHL